MAQTEKQPAAFGTLGSGTFELGKPTPGMGGLMFATVPATVPELRAEESNGKNYYFPGDDPTGDGVSNADPAFLERVKEAQKEIGQEQRTPRQQNAIDATQRNSYTGLRGGPTIENASRMRNDYLDSARKIVSEYDQQLQWMDNNSGRVEPPPIGPDDIVLGAVGIAAGLAKGGLRLLAKEGEGTALSAITRVFARDSAILKAAMIDAGKVIPAGFAAHHLIPTSVAKKEFGELFEAAAQHGFTTNGASNGIALPQKVADAISSQLPLHRGGHLAEYFEAAKTELRLVNTAYKAGHIVAADLPRHLDEISLVMRAKLISREVFLTRKDPLYEKFR